MRIVRLHFHQVNEIRPLWEQLNNLHLNRSAHFKDHFSRFSFEQRMAPLLSKDDLAIFVARLADKNIGYCIASISGTIGEIDSIFIENSHQRSGVGDKLMTEAEAWLTSKKTTTICTDVAAGNESVFGFYEKRGYVPRKTVLEKKHQKKS